MIKLTNNVSKLRDDLRSSEEKFNVESYLTSNEAGRYLSELPGLKDIISAVSGVIDKIAGFADMILGFLEKILSWLDLNKILDALGIRKLVEFIIDMVSAGLSAIGFPIGVRALIYDIFNSACIPIVGNDDYDRNKIEQFSILSLIIALSCSMGGSSYDDMYTIMTNTPDIVKTKDSIEDIKRDILLLTNSPTVKYVTSTGEYEVDMVQTNAQLDELNNTLAGLIDRLALLEARVDNLFTSIAPLLLNQLSVGVPTDLNNTLSLVSHMGAHRTSTLITDKYPGLGSVVISAIDNSLSLEIDPVRFNSGTKTPDAKPMLYDNPGLSNMCFPLGLCNSSLTNKDMYMHKLHNVSLDDTVSSILALDPSVSLYVLSYSIVIKTLALKELSDSPLQENEITVNSESCPITDNIRYLV